MRNILGAIGSGLGLALAIILAATAAAAAMTGGAVIALAWMMP